MSSNSVTMPSKLLPISGDGYTSDWTVRRCFQKFRSVDQSHKDEKCFFVFIIKSLYYLKIFLPENKLKNI